MEALEEGDTKYAIAQVMERQRPDHRLRSFRHG